MSHGLQFDVATPIRAAGRELGALRRVLDNWRAKRRRITTPRTRIPSWSMVELRSIIGILSNSAPYIKSPS